MRRLAFAAAICGTLALAACSDQNQSPTEPSVPPPSETFGTTCAHGRYPLRDVAALIPAAYPTTMVGYRALRAEALLRVGAIALLWDFCQDRLARQAAIKTIAWINLKPQSGGRDALKTAILNGLGGGAFEGDVVTGLFVPGDPNTTPEQVFETSGHDALIALTGDAFDKPTLITVRRLANTFTLEVPEGLEQAPPYYDFDATNSSTDNTVETHKPKPGTVVIVFCFEPPDATYGGLAGAQIGHNPVGGGFEFVPEVFDRQDLKDQLEACPSGESLRLGMGSHSGGLGRFTSFVASVARTLFLPAPLRAATVGGLGPIAGKPVSLSPFGIVLPDCEEFYNYNFCQYGPSLQ